MKKIVWIALLFLMVILSACSENSSTEAGKEGSSSEANGEETYELKMNVAFPAPVLDWEPKVKGTTEFAELVEERTDGRLKIEVFFNNQLAGQSESLDALAKGTFDIQSTTPTAWADRIPESSFATLPFWNKGPEHTTYMLRETELGVLDKSIS